MHNDARLQRQHYDDDNARLHAMRVAAYFTILTPRPYDKAHRSSDYVASWS